MKRFYTYFIMMAALVVGATSCSESPVESGNETIIPTTPSTESYELTISTGVASRASFGGSELTKLTWDSDDVLGLFIHDAGAEGEERHVGNNIKMSYIGDDQFRGILPKNPANRTEANKWKMFAYFPYNSAADELEKYDASTWTLMHASRQTQIDANHTNYDKYAFFSTVDNIAWENGEEAPKLMLQDRCAALRFLVTPGDDLDATIKEQLAQESIEEVDVYVVDELPEDLTSLSSANGVVPLSGHFKFNHETGTYKGVKNESLNYVEVDLYSPSTRLDEFKINITDDNSTYVWAVVPPFTLGEEQYLVAEINTASYKIYYVYDYPKADDYDFTANKLFNFKNVKATAANTFTNVPVVHTDENIEGASVVDSQTGKRYPTNVTLIGSVDLPIVGDIAGHNIKYYIRYGFCGNNNDKCDHNGLDTPWSEDLESEITWAHEIVSGLDTEQYYLAELAPLAEGADPYRRKFSKIVGTSYKLGSDVNAGAIEHQGLPQDEAILKAAFNGDNDPVYQAYAVCQETGRMYYGHVVHVELNPEVRDVVANLSYFSYDRFQIFVNVDSGYYVNWNWDASIGEYGGSTAQSLRVYRREIPAQYINDDNSLNVSLATAIAGVESVKLVSITESQSEYYRYNHWYQGNNQFVVMLWKGTQSLEGGPTPGQDHDDPSGAYCCVYQAYDATTHQLFWVRTEYFRLRDLVQIDK